MNPFRPATLVVALSLAFATQVSFGADAAASAAAPVASAPAAAPSRASTRPAWIPSVRVQDDLFTAVNGAWVKKTEIPADKSS